MQNRSLIVSSYAPPAIGGPNNLYCLLRDADPDSYAVLTSFYNIDNLSAKVGNWLSGDYIFYDKPNASKQEAMNPKDGSSSRGRDLLSRVKHWVKSNKVVRILLGFPVILGQVLAIYRRGKKAIKEGWFNRIVAFSDYGPAMIAGYFLHKKTGQPLHLFMFDLYKGNFLPFPGGWLSSYFEPRLMKAAKKVVLTNQGTKDIYMARYPEIDAKKFVVIHNSAFPEEYLKLYQERDMQAPYTILFTGRIYWPQIGALRNLLRAMDGINDLDIKLKFYCPNPRDYLKRLGISSDKLELDVAPPSEMPKIQGSADILFLPLSWGTKSQQIIDTATPGKLTDYLIAGRPILIHAPKTATVVKYARENDFAAVCDEDDVELLRKEVRKLIEDKEFAKRIVRNARATFLKNHDANKNSIKFMDVLK